MNPMQMAMMAVGSAGAASAFALKITPHTVIDTALFGNAEIEITFGLDGELSFVGSGAPTTTNEWMSPQAGFSDGGLFEVALTGLIAGSSPTPTSGPSLLTYTTLTSDVTWTKIFSGANPSTLTGTWRFRVREIADNSNFAEANLSYVLNV